MKKTKVRYYVDIVDKETGQTVVTVYDSYNSDEAYDVAKHWNEVLLERHSILHNPCVIAEVYEVEEYEEEEEMKKYELKDYKEFCREALVCPPIEEFDEGTIDEVEWYKQHYIKITCNNHEINIGYGADEVNEIEYALREIYEAVEGDGEATTGNTFGSQYRPAELKDIVRFFIMWRYENWGGLNWFDYAKQAVEELKDIQSVIGVYEEARKIEKDIEFKCNWHDFKVESLKDATEEGIKKIILDLVGSDIEISYDPSTDKSFIIDYTFKESGDFIDWSWGKVDEHSDDFNVLLESYKVCIFE